MTNTDIAGIITQQQFDAYAANWLTFISRAGNDDLRRLFDATGQQRLQFVSFPIEQVVWLLSTVGIRSIKARFLLKTDTAETHQPPRFTLALYATDALGGRISAYYMADVAWRAAPPQLHEVGGQIPHNLVKIWLDNWRNAPAITPAMFASNYGPLQGYNFTLDDFMDPLFDAQPFAGKILRVSFALHAYYPAVGMTAVPAQTFGLVLRIAGPDAQDDDGSSAPFYDLSKPYPPGAADS